ncbi:sugar-binding protein [Halioglobus maricola]|uniref:Sugar-binding protein n=1 Tax=Halioglobus maricola TaxID=2601894 RepID=A0A5P9NNH5_9GAMM|nr:sugar-binding protein [Halioglobus maricola]QFU77347.1 sugar-binding protein [Halioglobus maricola]
MNHYIALTLIAAATPVLAWQAPHTDSPPLIDGIDSDSVWQAGEWRPIDKPMVGTLPAADDFSARYKLRWDERNLYLLVEITDDVLIDSTPNPLERYWEDDTLEVFVDADASGGDHLENHNALAYHIALDGNVVDIAPPGRADAKAAPALFNEHLDSAWSRSASAPFKLIWELRVSIYTPGSGDANLQRLSLSPGHQLGFMVGYCDSDSSDGRENLYTDVEIAPINGDRNRGYIDADTFATLTLIK